MDFAFYHHDSEPRGLRSAILPFRRALRRLQRPYFLRLKDLLLTLWHANREREQEIHALEARMAAMERAYNDLLQRHRALMMDRGAMARRMATLEDLLAPAKPRLWREAA